MALAERMSTVTILPAPPAARLRHCVRVDIVGGYRLVRKLGEGERAEIYLGHAGATDPPEHDRTAAIKLFRRSTSAQSIDIEIEALARASCRHLLELRDLATAADGRPCLILPRLGAGSLARLIARRTGMEIGEAVTALAPIVSAIGELHRVGVAHGGIRLSSVPFDRTGAPVIARFGRASIIGEFPGCEGARSLTPAQLAGEPRVLEDLAGLSSMVRHVLDHIETSSGAAQVGDLRQWLDASNAGERPESFSQELADRLFDLAPALPIRLENPAAQRERAQVPPRAVLPSGTPAGGGDPALPLRGWFSALHLPGWIEQAISSSLDSHPFAALRVRIARTLAPVRRPVWSVGAAGLAALVVALTVLPSSHSARSGARPGALPTVSPAPTPSSPTVVADARAMVGDDPVAAAASLIAARGLCLQDRSVLCLGGVDQADSAAMEADSHLIRQVQRGEELPVGALLPGVQLRLVQRFGDSAIIHILLPGAGASPTHPASLLIVKGETGWRIRDLTLS